MLVGAPDDDAMTGQLAVRHLATSPGFRAEVEVLLPELRAAVAPIEHNDLLMKLMIAAPTYQIPDRPPAQWAALFAPYLAALEGLSAEMVDDAFLRWSRGEMYPQQPGRHAFYPKPAELHHLAQKSRLELHKALTRARKALDYVERLPPQTLTPEQVAQRRADAIAAGVLDENGKVIFRRPAPVVDDAEEGV